MSVVGLITTPWISSHSGDIREGNPPQPTNTTMRLGKLLVHPVPCRRAQIPGAGEESEARRLKMILLAALLVFQCVSVSAAEGGSAAALERIEDCGTGCSQVKQPPDLGERALPPLIFFFAT